METVKISPDKLDGDLARLQSILSAIVVFLSLQGHRAFGYEDASGLHVEAVVRGKQVLIDITDRQMPPRFVGAGILYTNITNLTEFMYYFNEVLNVD